MPKQPGERGWLLEHEIPRNDAGDPAFTCLEDIHDEFTEDELVYMINRYLYAQTYQREYHKQRSAQERDRLRPIKRKVHELFGVSYLNATPGQIRKAIEAVKADIAKRGEV